MSKENRRGEPPKKEIVLDDELDKKKNVDIVEEGEKKKQEEQKNEEDNFAEDSDEETVMYEKRCSLEFRKPGQGNHWQSMGTEKIQIVYDDEMNCCRVYFSDENGKSLFGNLITDKIKMKIENEVCIWGGHDYVAEKPEYQTVRAQFSSSLEATEFATIFAEAQDIFDIKWKKYFNTELN